MISFNSEERRNRRDWYVVSTLEDPELQVLITGYKPEGRGFDPKISLELFIDIILPAASMASNRNAYYEISWGQGGGG